MDLSILVDLIKNIAIFGAVLSVLIVVHEWGHFITAKKCGVKVERFSLGFGRKLFSKMHNGTEFLICLIPLGGYVKMAGDERAQCKGAPDEFHSKPVGLRGLIVVNGPVVNFVLAYVCLVFVFMLGFPDLPNRVGEIIKGTPAHQAGLQVGDEIVQVNAREVYGWTEIHEAISRTKKDQIDLVVLRDGQQIFKTLRPETVFKEDFLGQERLFKDIGVEPFESIIGEVGKGSPAERAGIKVGDRVTEIDSKPIAGWNELRDAIVSSTGDEILIRVIRDGQQLSMSVAPKIKKGKGPDGQDKEKRELGVSPHHTLETYSFGFIESIGRGFQKLTHITVLTYQAIFRMITGAMSAKENVTGPVGIFYIVKTAAEHGLSQLLYIVGVISASLAIFNLLPVIPLDGGHLFLLGIEKIRGRALSAKTDETIARVGFTLIICLALFVFYSDFDRLGWITKVRDLLP